MTDYIIAIPRQRGTLDELDAAARIAQQKRGLHYAVVGQSLHLSHGARAIAHDGRFWTRFIGDMWVEGADDAAPPTTELTMKDVCRMRGPRKSAGGHIFYGQDEAAGRHLIYRDPSGREACYHLMLDRFHLLFSDLEMLKLLSKAPVDLDRGQLIRSLILRDLREERTCIAGVREILPGQGLEIIGDHATNFEGWSPWDHVDGGRLSAEDHAQALGTAIDAVVARVADTRSSIIVELSGGLDSSILAAGLHRAKVDFSTLTLIPLGPDGDERAYAGAIAEAFGRKAYVRFPTAAHVDLEISAARHLPRPAAKSFTQAFDVIGAELADAIGAEAFVNGGGGDTVLGYFHSAAPVLDCWRTMGLGRAVWRSMADIAAITDVTIWEVFMSAVRRLRRPVARAGWKRIDDFLSPDILSEVQAEPAHPWLRIPEGALPGKIFQISSLLGIYNYLDGTMRGRDRPLLFPLLSQPVLEAALAIPSWMSCQSGHNRAVARAAFAERLPPVIMTRRSKGGFDGLCFDIFTTDRALIESRLMDGYLAAARIIDRVAVDAFFRRGSIPTGTEINRLLALMDVEAWVASLDLRAG